MKYRFQSNKTLDELRSTISANIYKDRTSAVDSIWDKNFEEKGKIFYGDVKNNKFSFKRLSMNGRLYSLSFNGEIIQNGTRTEIIGRFNYDFILNGLVYFIFLFVSVFLGIINGWIQKNSYAFFLFEISAFILYIIPSEFSRRREKHKFIYYLI
ncbi:hypothetical protein [Bacillus sp. EAC]|uniref:hypothetical protein n=1 Tax=Bacillus sp. EAC TaxID=1978338 RepID=UPI000B439233|nr:hypothetical protein [Bacillus sp. EAC]